MNKILSIVIPTYNMEKYLRRCLDSLLIDDKKLLEQLEILVVNDGSKDASSLIAHEYQNKLPGIFVVIDKENGNYGSCVNCGLSEAKGKYIKILDADDFFDKNSFSSFMAYLGEVDVDVVITNYNVVTTDGKLIRKWDFNFPQRGSLYISDYCESYCYKVLQMHAITYKRSKIIDNNYKQTEGISYTDQEWMFYPMSYMSTFSYLPVTVYQYGLGREGQTMDEDVRKKTISHMTKILYRQADFLNHANSQEMINGYMKTRFFQLVSMIYPMLIIVRQDINLEEIDEKVKEINPAIYDEISLLELDSRLWPFQYINHWRNNNKIKLWFIMSGYEMMKRIKNMVR